MPTSHHRVARQNGYDPPVHFRPPSVCAGIVHHLSGPTRRPNRSRLTLAASSPWSVFQDGWGIPHSSAGIFISHLPFFTLRSLYFSAIGHPVVFSLRWMAPPLQAALPSNPTPRNSRPALQASHPLRTSFPGHSGRPASSQPGRPVTTGAPPLSLAATPGILVSFFSSPY